jgi:hypothetical protein
MEARTEKYNSHHKYRTASTIRCKITTGQQLHEDLGRKSALRILYHNHIVNDYVSMLVQGAAAWRPIINHEPAPKSNGFKGSWINLCPPLGAAQGRNKKSAAQGRHPVPLLTL